MRAAKIISLLVLAAVVGLYGYFRFEQPFGIRTCYLPCMVSALFSYACENSDRYPDGPDPYVALQALYPQQMPSPELLAGISGDRKATARVLESGGCLTSNECSWIYIPGLSTTNEANTILIYERLSGVAFNGRRAPGRAVGFVDGSHRQMPEHEFQLLLKKQQDGRVPK